jgi:hypothetical protein
MNDDHEDERAAHKAGKCRGLPYCEDCIAERDLDQMILYTVEQLDREQAMKGGEKMKRGDDFYKKLADIQNAKISHPGNHSHLCPRCGARRYCPQITHCTKPEESFCFDCLDKIASARG